MKNKLNNLTCSAVMALVMALVGSAGCAAQRISGQLSVTPLLHMRTQPKGGKCINTVTIDSTKNPSEPVTLADIGCDGRTVQMIGGGLRTFYRDTPPPLDDFESDEDYENYMRMHRALFNEADRVLKKYLDGPGKDVPDLLYKKVLNCQWHVYNMLNGL